MTVVLPLRRPPLAFPGGRPGFDPSHPCAPGTLLSAVPCGGSMINLVNGVMGILGGSTTPSPVIDHNGPAIAASQGQITWGGYYTAQPHYVTFGCIVTMPPTSIINAATYMSLFSNSTSYGAGNQLFPLLSSTTGPNWNNWSGTGGLSAPFPYAGDTPHFMVSSWDTVGGDTNTLLMNMATGQTYSVNGNGGPGVVASGMTGVLSLGNYFFQSVASISAAMHSTNKMSLAQMRKWSQDPWAFWYP